MIVLIILLILLSLYIGFIVVPAALIFRFAFSRKPCSVPLTERGTLEGTRYAPYADRLIPAERFVKAQPHERVRVTARDGVILAGSYYDNRSDRTMIFVHGYRGAPVSNFCAQAEHFYHKGWNLLFITQRAHGMSGGRWLGLGVLEQHDLPVWIEYAASKDGVESIVLYGSSMGASAVGYASDKITEPKVKALVMDCGFVSPYRQLVRDARVRHLPYHLLLPVMRLCGFVCFREDIYRKVTDSLKSTAIPVLFLHGEADKTVSIDQGRENYNACASQKQFIAVPNAEHILAYTAGRKETEMKTDRFLDIFV